MDQRERYLDPAETLRVAMSNWQSRLWTALPCVVQAFPSASGLSKMMLDAQPIISGSVLNADGGIDIIDMPLLINVPIQWMGGGGVTATFPIKPGDECTVIFASRCIDSWWQQGAAAVGLPPPDSRMHNLSDGIALVGLRSLPREFAVDNANACLITDDGQAYFKLNPTTYAVNILANGGITMTSSGGINLNGATVDKNGNIVTPTNITGATVTGNTDVVATTKSLKAHVHTGGTLTGGLTGANK